MKVDKYRVVSFDQGGRLAAAFQARAQHITNATQNPSDMALNQLAVVASKEYLAVHKTGGVCEALSLKWLKTKFKENSDQWNLDRQKAGPRVASVDREKTVDRAFARYAATAADQRTGLEDFYGLRAAFDPNVFTTQHGMTSYVARAVANSKHGYFLHIIKCPSLSADGQHAIAYYTSSGKIFNVSNHVYMFDPDYGEYKIPNGEFAVWMPKFLLKFYGTRESDTVSLKTISLGNKRATP